MNNNKHNIEYENNMNICICRFCKTLETEVVLSFSQGTGLKMPLRLMICLFVCLSILLKQAEGLSMGYTWEFARNTEKVLHGKMYSPLQITRTVSTEKPSKEIDDVHDLFMDLVRFSFSFKLTNCNY